MVILTVWSHVSRMTLVSRSNWLASFARRNTSSCPAILWGHRAWHGTGVGRIAARPGLTTRWLLFGPMGALLNTKEGRDLHLSADDVPQLRHHVSQIWSDYAAPLPIEIVAVASTTNQSRSRHPLDCYWIDYPCTTLGAFRCPHCWRNSAVSGWVPPGRHGILSPCPFWSYSTAWGTLHTLAQWYCTLWAQLISVASLVNSGKLAFLNLPITTSLRFSDFNSTNTDASTRLQFLLMINLLAPFVNSAPTLTSGYHLTRNIPNIRRTEQGPGQWRSGDPTAQLGWEYLVSSSKWIRCGLQDSWRSVDGSRSNMAHQTRKWGTTALQEFPASRPTFSEASRKDQTGLAWSHRWRRSLQLPYHSTSTHGRSWWDSLPSYPHWDKQTATLCVTACSLHHAGDHQSQCQGTGLVSRSSSNSLHHTRCTRVMPTTSWTFTTTGTARGQPATMDDS